jgi:hypothetical protein
LKLFARANFEEKIRPNVTYTIKENIAEIQIGTWEHMLQCDECTLE